MINSYLFQGISEVESRTAYDYRNKNEMEIKLMDFIRSHKVVQKGSKEYSLMKGFETVLIERRFDKWKELEDMFITYSEFTIQHE